MSPNTSALKIKELFIADLKHIYIFHMVVLVRKISVYFYPCLHVCEPFQSLSVTIDGLYTPFTPHEVCTLSADEGDRFKMFLSSHYCTNGNHSVLAHPQRFTLCV